MNARVTEPPEVTGVPGLWLRKTHIILHKMSRDT